MAVVNHVTNELTLGLNDEQVFGDEQNVWGFERSLDWRLAWQRAIAKAWAFPAYRDKLLKHPSEALAEVGWDVPRGLKIKIEAVSEDSISWDGEVHKHKLVRDGKTIAANGWACKVEIHKGKNGSVEATVHDEREKLLDALQTTVTLKLPPRPKDSDLLALASADYEGLARAYPFTCMTC
jgi:hypothetical protein